MLRKMILVLSILGVVVVTLSVGYVSLKRSQSRLQEIHSVGELREQFNSDREMPRLVLLLSPT